MCSDINFEVYRGPAGPVVIKRRQIFNFPQINVHLQVIPRCRRTEPISLASIQRTSQEMENRFSFTRHQSLQPETVRPSQLTVCQSIHLFLCCLEVSLLFFFHPSDGFLCPKYVCFASEDIRMCGMRGLRQRWDPPAKTSHDQINSLRR